MIPMETPRGMEADFRNGLFADHSDIRPWGIGGITEPYGQQ